MSYFTTRKPKKIPPKLKIIYPKTAIRMKQIKNFYIRDSPNVDEWMSLFLVKISEGGVSLLALTKYVDDLNIVAMLLDYGSKWSDDKVVHCTVPCRRRRIVPWASPGTWSPLR